jgi:ribose transport system ATP-binding protein
LSSKAASFSSLKIPASRHPCGWLFFQPRPFPYPAMHEPNSAVASSPTGPSASAAPLLEVRGLSKSFPGVKALDDVSLQLQAGEVLAVIGENGAGKSSLMKILAGVQTADSGEILLAGDRVRFQSTREAIEAGVVLIHQELNLCDNLNVGQNIFLEPRVGPFIQRKEIERRSTEFLDAVGLRTSPRTLVGRLSVGQQQMVEIAKALSVQARVIIFDEPTSSLSAKETESLFAMIRSLQQQGVGIIYISHRLEEVKQLASRVTVLRDGRNAGDLARAQITHDNMVSRMIGRDVTKVYSRTRHELGPVVLKVREAVTQTYPEQSVSFEVRAGEIVGIAGLVGAGRSELLRGIFGVDRLKSGSIEISGQERQVHSAYEAQSAGLALVPEDRKQQGLIVEFNIRNNIGLAKLRGSSGKGGWINFADQRVSARQAIENLNIKTSSDLKLAKFLSGGNQQKVVIGKWLAVAPRVLLLDEPTRGIDVGAKQEIYKLVESLAREQMAILFVSSEMEEVLGLADRVLVMHEGRLTGELNQNQLNEENIMRLATGQSLAPQPAKN